MKVTGGLRFSIATAVAVAALVPASATAHKVHWSTNSTISAEYYPAQFGPEGRAGGQLSSPKPACIANRTVKVYRNDVYVEQTTSTDSGFWQVFYEAPADGMISAIVTRKNIGPAGHRHICKRYVAGPVNAVFISS